MTQSSQKSTEEQTAEPAAGLRIPILDDAFCPHCGYNLRGLTSARCPECGSEIDPANLITTRIPWAHRINRGRLRAYWQTVRSVIAHPIRFCEEVDRPVGYTDARRFHWMTLLHVCVLLLAATVCLAVLAAAGLLRNTEANALLAAVWPIPVLHLAFLAALVPATGVHSYFFHPRHLTVERQNRAVAISYYAAAPLAWFPVPVALSFAGFLMLDLLSGGPPQQAANLLIVAAVLFLIAQLVAWWVLTVIFFRQLAHRPARRIPFLAPVRPGYRLFQRRGTGPVFFALCVSALWLISFALTFLLVALVGFYVAAAIISLA